MNKEHNTYIVSSLSLREIRADDLESLYRLDQECFVPEIAYSRRQLLRFLSLPMAQAILAEGDGEILGFVIGGVTQRRLGRVITLDVSPRHRRSGIGKTLLSQLLARLAAGGIEQVRLEVDTSNEAAIRFYEVFGFHRRRRLPDYYGPHRPAWEMEVEISNSPGVSNLES